MKFFYTFLFYLFFPGLAYSQIDLLINSLTVNTDGNNPIYVGNTITGTLSIKNVGNLKSGKCFTSIYISPAADPAQGFLLGKISLQSIEALQTTSNIIFNYPIPYSIVNDGSYYIVAYIDENNSLAEPNKANNSYALQIPTQVKGKLSARAAQNLPYPIIFIHGLNDDNRTWNFLIDSLQKCFGWGYGGNMNFSLNYDGDVSQSNKNKDYYDYTYESSLRKDDYYTINFNVDKNGAPLYDLTSIERLLLKEESNQSAIVKQGLAISDAIKHVLKVTGKDKVILVGHSMGGLASREYLQNSSIWQSDGLHHVAKLLTIGSPHGGSNADFGALDGAIELYKGLDSRSEAVRDLRRWYSYPPFNKGVYLSGGKENLLSMVDKYGELYYNADVNCDGIENGDSIDGLNSNSKVLPEDIAFACIIGTKEIFGGDGIVSEECANLNNYKPSANADTFFIPKTTGSPWHSELPKQVEVVLKGLDEPNFLKDAYGVEINKLYFGNLTKQSDNYFHIRDDDTYFVNISSKGKLNIQLFNIPTPYITISIYSDLNLNKNNPVPIKLVNSNGAGYMNESFPVNEGKYYLVLSGVPDNDTWKSQYGFQLSLNTTPPTYPSCLTNLIATTGSFSDGSGSSNYANNTNCSWLINPTGVSSITLRFNSFITESIYDTVNVYDGNDDTYPLLGKFSGNSIPASITSTGSSLFVTFKSNGSTTATGWDATYTSNISQNSARFPTYTSGYKYWFDNDLNNGLTVNQNFSNGDSILTFLQIPTTFKPGFHSVSIMIKQSDNQWSIPITNSFYYCQSKSTASYEYWFDSAYNSKQIIEISDTTNLILTNQMLNIASLANGFHQINIRFKPNGGSWSVVQSSNFFKYSSNNSPASYEYWFDSAYNSKQIIEISDTTDLILTNQMLNMASLANGFHQINIRFKPNGGSWSVVQSSSFFKRGNDNNEFIVVKKMRYWFDSSFSKQKEIITSGQNGIINNVIDSSALSLGRHSLNYQIMDNSNIWSVILTDSFTVTCLPPPAPLINSKNKITFCKGETDTLQSSALIGNQWYLNGIAIPNATNNIYVAHEKGIYSTVVSSNGCFSDTSNKIILTVNDLPIKPIISQTGLELRTITGMISYQWYKGTTSYAIPNETNSTYTPKSSENYFVRITNNAKCSSTSDAFNYKLSSYNNLLPSESVNVYPNPTTGIINIDFKVLKNLKINAILFNMNGVKILEKPIISGNRINIANLANGTYTLMLISINTKKIYLSIRIIKIK